MKKDWKKELDEQDLALYHKMMELFPYDTMDNVLERFYFAGKNNGKIEIIKELEKDTNESR